MLVVHSTSRLRAVASMKLNSSYNHNALTIYRTFMNESLRMHFEVAVKKVMLLTQAAQVISSQSSYNWFAFLQSVAHSTDLGLQEAGSVMLFPNLMQQKVSLSLLF